jgi:hypothetical protein
MAVPFTETIEALARRLTSICSGRNRNTGRESSESNAPAATHRLEGTFWLAETPERRCVGHLTLAPAPMLDIYGRLFDERAHRVDRSPTGGVTITSSGNPDDLVADFAPRTIYGELVDGRQISIIGAQGGRKSGPMMRYDQQFRTIRRVLIDSHVDGAQPYSSCRFKLIGPAWWSSRDGFAETATGGRLVSTAEADDRWFEYTPAQPMSVRDFDRWVIGPVEALAGLVTGTPAYAIDVHVRRTDDEPWQKIHRADQRDVSDSGSELLDAGHLTAERFARWIDFRSDSDGLDAAVIDNLDNVAIQTKVLAFAAVAEGLHQRLYPKRKRVPALSHADLKKARDAAREAALEAAREADRTGRDELTNEDLAEFKEAMNQAFGFVNEMTYRTRLADLVNTARDAIPGIVSPFADWPKSVQIARNTLAHRGNDSYDKDIDQFYDLLIALGYSIPWVLRTTLLLKAGLDSEALREAYKRSSAYNNHITNCRNLLAGGPHGGS